MDTAKLIAGLRAFQPTPPLLHALIICKGAMSPDCVAMEIEFDIAGEPHATVYRRADRQDGGAVALSADAAAAAGLLLQYVTFQYIMLVRALEKLRQHDAEAVKDGFEASLKEFGLSLGLFTEARTDTLIVTR